MAYFKRKIDSNLLEWKNSRNRKPLLVRGARQIGKSCSIRNFAKNFKYFIEVNFESRKDLVKLFEFEEAYDVNVICQRLSILYSTPIIAGEPLLFFEEVQASEAALKSLWFFKENMPQLHVIAAGALLEFALKNISSYGVGRVSSIFMYPLSFEEFLWALGKESWAEALTHGSPDSPLFEPLYKDITSTYRTFLMVGGMPASVKAWVETLDFRECVNELADIQQTYYDDFSKYSNKISPELLRNTLQSVVAQAGGRFIFSKVSGGYSIENIKKALGMLSDAGLIKAVRLTSANGLPLGAEVNEKFTKYIFLDSGLMLRVLDLDFGGAQAITEIILAGSEEDLVNKGIMAELSVGWELVKGADVRHRHELYYWENLAKGATSEIDYVIPDNMQVLPIEVKAGTSGKMKSLRLFMQKKNLTYAVRT
ncbi:MAG: ATP-binding protein, partial [Muribaculaceae bacterium]|nr:ATP-binding protein [Muribaculaceae bacterium]